MQMDMSGIKPDTRLDLVDIGDYETIVVFSVRADRQ